MSPGVTALLLSKLSRVSGPVNLLAIVRLKFTHTKGLISQESLVVLRPIP